MQTYTQAIPKPESRWTSVHSSVSKTGYGLNEAADLFGKEKRAQAVLRLAGGMMIAAAYLQWFLPMLLGQAGTFPQHIVLGSIFLATGAGIYLFASRGFRKVLFIDLANRCVEVALADSRKTKVTLRSFPIAAIGKLRNVT